MSADQCGHPGASFSKAEVVRNYVFRPPYPDGVLDKLLEVAPAREAMLDIGCGPGKLSRPLSRHFAHVCAVDPSTEMIALGRSLENGAAPNIEWITGFAETFRAERKFDLTVAGASVHWMDHERLFAHLRALAKPRHVMAVVSGDAPHEPDWQADWLEFMGKWVPMLTGHPFDREAFAEDGLRYRAYLAGHERCDFLSEPFVQGTEDFIRCQHSRDTFSPDRLGEHQPAFDAELRTLLKPHARDGLLTFRVATRLEWGTIKEG